MSFLMWNNEADMRTSLGAVNDLFGCSYSDGSYVMERWAEGSKHATANLWGFAGFKEQHLGVSKAQAMMVLVGNYQEVATQPEGWLAQTAGV